MSKKPRKISMTSKNGIHYNIHDKQVHIIEELLTYTDKEVWWQCPLNPNVYISENGKIKVTDALAGKQPQLRSTLNVLYLIYPIEYNGKPHDYSIIMKDIFFQTYKQKIPGFTDKPFGAFKAGIKYHYFASHHIRGTDIPYCLPLDYLGPMTDELRQAIIAKNALRIRNTKSFESAAKMLLEEKRSGKRLPKDHPTRLWDYFPDRTKIFAKRSL